jgi:hypothetical protein
LSTLHLGERRARFMKKLHAGDCQRDGAFGSIDEPHAQRALECLQLHSERRGCEVQYRRGTREMQLLGQRHEVG